MKKGDVDVPQHKLGNMAENSIGGTELLTMELFKRLLKNTKIIFNSLFLANMNLKINSFILAS